MNRLIGILLVLAVCGVSAVSVSAAATEPDVRAAAKVRVPNVVGMRMDRATRTLRTAALRVNEECSGLFGCIVKSQWWVCAQDPRPGTRLSKYAVVVIYAERRGEC